MFGDSLSAAYGIDLDKGWVALLENQLQKTHPNWQVVNVSISGETTSGGLSRLPAELEKHSPDLVLLELGANDGLRGTPLKSIQKNFSAMLQLLADSKTPTLLFEMQMPPNYGPAYTKRFNTIYKDLSSEFDVTLVPFFLDGIAGQEQLNQPDGIHPTAEAQPILFKNVWPTIEPHLK
ncbi:arylesterase [Parendozoicomonas sp. Alg238-R29]|uniref:arylesterase n=1 Tax=Parendozoicomonas sp. Alg238-R29 TaxID=2993446 RepID=UPI00248DB3EA|nr:arylesterase [Parendozoicomonas sp. Alg238-R29]